MSAALELIEVEKHFGLTPIIRGVTWTVEENECHVLVGPNGAGKSTLFHLISGRFAPSAGSIKLFGQETAGWPAHRIVSAGLARSFQINNLFPRLSAYENVRASAIVSTGMRISPFRLLKNGDAADRRARATLEEVGLANKASIPAGTLTYADQRALEIAIALASNARVIILDEPTAGMNNEDSSRIISLVNTLKGRKTIVLIEHDLNVVFGVADRLSVLVHGRIVACGTPEAVRSQQVVREAYLGTEVANA